MPALSTARALRQRMAAYIAIAVIAKKMVGLVKQIPMTAMPQAPRPARQASRIMRGNLAYRVGHDHHHTGTQDPRTVTARISGSVYATAITLAPTPAYNAVHPRQMYAAPIRQVDERWRSHRG